MDECIDNNFLIRINLVLLSLKRSELKFLLIKSKHGNWHLPYTFLSLNENLEQAAKKIINQYVNKQKINIFPLKNQESDKKNSLKKTILVNYLSIKKNGKLRLRINEEITDFNWFHKKEIPNLIYQEKLIIDNALEVIKFIIGNYPKEIFNFLPNEFTLSELQNSFLNIGLENKQFKEKRNFRKWINQISINRKFIIYTSKMKYGIHRPAKLYMANI